MITTMLLIGLFFGSFLFAVLWFNNDDDDGGNFA